VVGLIGVTTVMLARAAIPSVASLAIALAGLGVLYGWKSRFVIPILMVAAGVTGALVF
jgi:chromate transport protein ChrA